MFRFSSILQRLPRVEITTLTVRNATKKAGGSTRNGRDSIGKRLGLKKFGGEHVIPGNIIIRQRGTTYHAGENVKVGKDYTLYSVMEGWVKFKYDKKKKHQVVSVVDYNPNPPPQQQQQQQQQQQASVEIQN